MRKITILLTIIFLNFAVNAQDNMVRDVTLKGVQIGQKVPEITIMGLNNYKDKNGKPATTAKISDFKGKLLILDFWATWCSPCVAMIPKMDSLQKQFGDKIQFLSVTYQTEKEVLPFLEKFEKQRGKLYDLPVVTAEKELHKLFPHVYLPHYVWIDGDGIVRAITGYEEVNNTNITNILKNDVALERKSDTKVAYDKSSPLIFDGNGGDASNLRYYTLLSGYLDGLDQSFRVSAINDIQGRKLTCSNLSILKLFALAYGGDDYYFGPNRIETKTNQEHLFRSGQSLTGNALKKWLSEGHAFCYEIRVPKGKGNKIFEIMKADLALNFPMFNIEVVRKMTKCWLLIRTTSVDKMKSAGVGHVNKYTPFGVKVINSTIPLFLSRLERLYLAKEYPLIDKTGYLGPVDIELKANMSNVEQLNLELARYDLKFIEKEIETEILSITDCK